MARKSIPREASPTDLIDGLWRGHSSVTMRRAEWQRVLLWYGADHLHMRAGIGHRLKGRHAGAGIYEVRLVAA